jgi:hypothetical protein
MSQLNVKLSDRADALIAQLQKEIFNRRRKKVSAAGVIETLVESGAKSQSDKRFATSWKNLVADIEKAAKVADAHGAKPASLSDEEWALVLSHRTRTPRAATPTKRRSPARKPAASKPAASKPAASKAAAAKPAADKPAASKAAANKPAPRKPAARKPVVKAAASTSVATKRTRSSVAKRMAKAVSRLTTTTQPAVVAPSGNGALKQPVAV